MKSPYYSRFFIISSSTLLILYFLSGCGVDYKIRTIQKKNITADVLLGKNEMDKKADKIIEYAESVKVDLEPDNSNGIYMEAEVDTLTGDIIPTDQLNEIVVQATFRNVAERNGVIDIAFDVMVPKELQQPQWQVRFTPRFYILNDTLELEKVFITGARFRKLQQKGYGIYNRYANMVVDDTLCNKRFVYGNLMEKFVSRHNNMASLAQQHYRKSLSIKLNQRRENDKDRMFNRFVKDPYPKEGIRLDSVVANANGVIKYSYSQSVYARKDLRKVEMVMDGEIYKDGTKLYVLSTTKPLTFYVSSMVSFIDNTPMYVTQVISRNMLLSENYNINFKKGEWGIEQAYSDNMSEVLKMKEKIRDVLLDTTYVVDSLMIAATCSPDGNIGLNNKLSGRRALAIKGMVKGYIDSLKESLTEQVWNINIADVEEISTPMFPDFKIVIENRSEDWNRLFDLISVNDSIKTKGIVEKCAGIDNLDTRENVLRGMSEYKYIKEHLYPLLRRVNLNFAMHRKGMLKDTVHTMVIDSVYMCGVEALKDRDYKKALTHLKNYRCLNTAIAYLSLDYNNSAANVLESLPVGSVRDYMLAIVYSRLNEEKKAVEYLLSAYEMDNSIRHRGNLDPEISLLIKQYKLFTNY